MRRRRIRLRDDSRALAMNRPARVAARASEAPRFWPLALGLALILCVARGAWVLQAMPEVPVLDEWSAIDGIALPNAAQGFDPRYLLAPHNEHLLVWTKLLDWLQLRVNDNQFDARPLGLAFALLAGFGAALLLAAAARRLAGGRIAFLVAGIALFALPYAWENLTHNWNNSHALLVAAAFATLHVAACGRGAAAVAAMVLATLFSALTMGTGAVAPVLGIAVVLWRWRAGDLRAGIAIAFVVAQAAAVAVAVFLLAGRAHPGPRPPLDLAPTCLQVALLLAVFAPAARLGGRVARTPHAMQHAPPLRDDVLAVVLALWGCMHIAAMIAFRTEFRLWMPISRYMDTIAFALLADLYCALRLADGGAISPRMRAAIRSGARIFAAVALLAAPLPLALLQWQAQRLESAQQLVRDVVQRRDIGALDRVDADALVYPERDYLRAHLSDPRVQRILGDRYGTRPQAARAVAASRAIEEWLMRHAALLCAVAALAAAALITIAFGERATVDAAAMRTDP
jgi:hypothetical protein